MTDRDEDPYTWDNGQQAPDWLTEWVRRMLEAGSSAWDKLDNIEERTAEMTETTTDEGVPALTAQDRCDRCGAQALVLVCIPSVSGAPQSSPIAGSEQTDTFVPVLLFCAHHARRHAVALAEQGAVVLADDRASVK